MSEKKHTPEPWIQMGTEIADDGYEHIAVINGITDNELNEANAKRIVECVNACAGMEEPKLEIESLKLANKLLEVSKSELTEERDDLSECTKDMSEHVVLIEKLNSKLLTQRDELAEALHSLIQTVITENPNAEFGPAIKKARAVISNYQS